MTKPTATFLLGIIIGAFAALVSAYFNRPDDNNAKYKKEVQAYADTAKTNERTAIRNYNEGQAHKDRADSIILVITENEKLIKKYQNENRNHWTASDYQSYYDRELGAGSPD